MPGESVSIPSIGNHLGQVERDVKENKREFVEYKTHNQQSLSALHVEIAGLGDRISKRLDEMSSRIDNMRDCLQNQIDQFTRDKIMAEGKAQGLAEAKNIDAQVKAQAAEEAKPDPWALAIVPVVIAVLLTLIVTWLIRDKIQGPTQDIRTTTTTQMPLAAPPPPAQATPSPSPPTVPAPPAPDGVTPSTN
jgi:hypothetical protein